MRHIILLCALLCSGLAVAQDYQAAVDHPQRPASDREDDERRKPVDVMRFAGVRSGDVVLEIGAGRGYTTELTSRLIGDDGTLYAHGLDPARLIGNRLPNVVPVAPEPKNPAERFAATGIEPESVDRVLAFFSLHDGYLDSTADIQGWYRAIFACLKPGGELVVLDNTAVADSGITYASDLHRIDPEFLKQEIIRGGFEFEAESHVLRNPDDDLMSSWFEDIDGRPAGYQDRFAYRFRKP